MIATTLLERGRPTADGGITWNRGCGLLGEPLDDSGLFNGRIGEALFLAAAFRSLAEPAFRDASLRALSGLRRGLADPEWRRRWQHVVGPGIVGVASTAYAFCRIADLLDMPSLGETAWQAAESLPTDPAAMRALDVTGGVAGALLGVLAVARRHPNGDARARAHRFAAALADFLADAVERDDRDADAGFAHGTTGIAYALLVASALAGGRAYRWCATARALLAREAALYRSDVNDWADRPTQEAHELHPRWCHGAVGVGHARLAAVATAGSAEYLADLEHVVARVGDPTLQGPHNLCCGTAGCVDFLVEAHHVLQRPDLLAMARRRSAPLLPPILRGELATICADEQTATGPGLWRGISGIGYTFLRLADPLTHPSPLILG